MRTVTGSFFAIICLLQILSSQNTQAQFLKKIKNEIKNRAERKVITKAGDATDKTIDNTINGVTKKGDATPADKENPSDADPEKAVVPGNIYKNYDFVAGDRIIFQPDLSTEPDAELPARFAVKMGNAEIQSFKDEKILHLQPDANTTIAPSMSTENYLPAQFTVEFDMMYENNASHFQFVNDFQVRFHKPDNNYNTPLFRFAIDNNSRVIFGGIGAGGQEFQEDLKRSVNTGNIWHHVAIYVRDNIGKAYIDQYRVAATNTLPVGAGKLSITTDRYGIKIRNFRLAAGGDDKYRKIVTDGKFITHGILFDVNKSTIKPESMGALNEIAKLMKEHSDLQFQIDGHTDGDGKADANMKLSQDRADAVKTKLIELGVNESRLTTKGFGASKPIDKNGSAEGKANNRRVEFIKLNN